MPVDYSLSDQAGNTFRSELNDIIAALVAQNSGSSAPSSTFAGMWWYDTTNGLLKRRNAANSGWINCLGFASSMVQAKSGSYTAVAADMDTLLDCTGTWSLALTAAATLGDGWRVMVRNSGTGVITIDPDSSEQVNGATTRALKAGDSCEIVCNGSAFKTVGLAPSVSYETIWVPAAAMTPRTTNGPTSATNESTTNKRMDLTLDFNQSTAQYAQFQVAMPKAWDLGTLTAQFFWRAPGGTGDVVWGCQAVASSDDDTWDAAFGTAQTVTDSVTATGDQMTSAASAAITAAGSPAAGDLVTFQVYRDAANVADTLAADAKLIGVKLIYSTSARDDS
jgi:hypothetical protein